MSLDAQYQTNITTVQDGNSGGLRIDASRRLIITGEAAAPIPVYNTEPVGGGVTWGAPTAVASDGNSKTLIAANAARKAIIIWNPIGNAQMSIDIKGGTVTLAAGYPLLAGDSAAFTGTDTPVTLITFIGTNTQNLVYQEGT